jgi:hypothetical protein
MARFCLRRKDIAEKKEREQGEREEAEDIKARS